MELSSTQPLKQFYGTQTVKLAVGEICHLNPYSVTPNTPLREVAKTMAEKHYGSAIVIENGKLAGIVTTIDICRYVAEHL